MYDFDTSIRKRQHVLSSAEDEAQALQEQSSREAVARVRDRESDESDDEEELKREGVQLIRSAPAVGETLTSQMAEQVGQARLLHGMQVDEMSKEMRQLAARAAEAEGKIDGATTSSDRALARAESDLAVALESLRERSRREHYHVDVAHPIHGGFRAEIHDAVVRAWEQLRDRGLPGSLLL